jgi:dTDP-4-amino-4,6-dideoxygalactose transaminase
MPFGAPIIFENWQGFNSLVIDAAASLGAIPPDFNKMPQNTMVIFSLHATKIFGAGEGALVVCKNLDLAEKLRAWSNFGFRNSRIADSGGTNAKMSEFTAAIALASIRDRESEIDSWNSKLEYARQLDYPNEFRTIVENYPGIRPYWIIQLENLHQKQKMIEHLALNMVETRSWWSTTLSTMPAFTQLKKIINTINSKYFSETHLGLPLWQDISDEQLQHIAKCLKSFNS